MFCYGGFLFCPLGLCVQSFLGVLFSGFSRCLCSSLTEVCHSTSDLGNEKGRTVYPLNLKLSLKPKLKGFSCLTEA